MRWDLPHLLLLWAMWSVMMTAMMLPSAAPLLLLYGAAARRSQQQAARQQIYSLAGGYLAAWAAFSLAATVLQRAMAPLLLVSPMMEAGSPRVSATLLGLTVFVAFEKLAPFGRRSAQFAGAVMVAVGLWLLLKE